MEASVLIPVQLPLFLCAQEHMLLHIGAHMKGETPGTLCTHTNQQSQLSGLAWSLEGTPEHQEQKQPSPACRTWIDPPILIKLCQV